MSFIDKLGDKISELKDDIKDVIKERKHSHSSSASSSSDPRHGSISSSSDLASPPPVFLPTTPSHDETISHTHAQHHRTSVHGPVLAQEPLTLNLPPPADAVKFELGETASLSGDHTVQRRRSVTQLAAGFEKMSSTSSSSSGGAGRDTSPTKRHAPVAPHDASPPLKDASGNILPPEEKGRAVMNEDCMLEGTVHKIERNETTGKPSAVHVHSIRKPTILLNEPKFQRFTKESTTTTNNKAPFDDKTLQTIAIAVGVVSLIITLWKPISSFLSGYFVGFLFASALTYILIRMYVNTKRQENEVNEWIEFPELESLIQRKAVKEDKDTTLQASGELVFGRYDADRDDDFIRYPCILRLHDYRLIVSLPTKALPDEQSSKEKEKNREVKLVGYREYFVKEAKLILVPEATMTRAKYWLSEYPLVIQDVQINDKQITSKQNLDKTKLNSDDFFSNPSTVLSIWFQTSPEKEDWFRKLSLVLKTGKEDVERTDLLTSAMQSGDGLSLSSSSPSLSEEAEIRRDMADARARFPSSQWKNTTSDVSAPTSEAEAAKLLHKSSSDDSTRLSFSQLLRNEQTTSETVVKKVEEMAGRGDEDPNRKDNTNTLRVAASSPARPDLVQLNTSLEKMLLSPECLDEAAVTINFLLRRFLCDKSEKAMGRELIKNKLETKMKEMALTVLDEIKMTNLDFGTSFPVVLKIEPMQWNSRGMWFNIFLFYRGSFKISIRTRLLLHKLIGYDPAKDPPLYAQHACAQKVHIDDERIDEDDFERRHKLLAKEPEVAEFTPARMAGNALKNIATNKWFQLITSFAPVKSLLERFAQTDVGADVEVTSFSGVLTLNIPPPPSDRVWVGFPEVPDMNIAVTPVLGATKLPYTLIQDFLSAKIRAELKRLVVLPQMDDQILPMFRDWVIDAIGEIIKKPVDPTTDNYRSKLNKASPPPSPPSPPRSAAAVPVAAPRASEQAIHFSKSGLGGGDPLGAIVPPPPPSTTASTKSSIDTVEL